MPLNQSCHSAIVAATCPSRNIFLKHKWVSAGILWVKGCHSTFNWSPCASQQFALSRLPTHSAPCTLRGVFEPHHHLVHSHYHWQDPLDFNLHHWCQCTAMHMVIWDGSLRIFGRVLLTVAGTGGLTQKVGGKKGGCS